MQRETHTYTSFSYKGKLMVFNTPNDVCLWRVKTLLQKEPCTIEWLESLKPSDVLWDVGSNIGIYTVFAAVMTGCKVYSFEPESQNYAIQTRTIVKNGIDANVKAYCLALGNNSRIGALGLSSNESGTSGHSIKRSNAKFSQGTVILDGDRVASLGVQMPTHIKIDVDGLDHEVIEGCRRQVINSVQSILIELDTSNVNQMKVVSFLEEKGFYYDPKQVERTAREKGSNFENFREFIFKRYQ